MVKTKNKLQNLPIRCALLCFGDSQISYFFRYSVSGGLTAVAQFGAMAILVGLLGFKTQLLTNIANIISIEFALLVAFILHSRLTWRFKYNSKKQVYQKLLSFHAVTTISIIARVILFYYLSLIPIDYRLNTLLGIALSVILNFAGYNRLVFLRRNYLLLMMLLYRA